MMWFRYRWVLAFSHGLCIKIIRGGNAVKELSLEIDALLAKPFNIETGKEILEKLIMLINILDSIIFSAGALMYREEKDLIKFSRRVEETARKLIRRIKREKGMYERDVREMRRMMDELKRKKQKIGEGFQKRVDKEKTRLEQDEARKKEIIGLLHDMSSFIEEMDSKINDLHLGAKAQRRGTLNAYSLEENIIIRSGYRLGKRIKGEGVEAGALIGSIRRKLDYFGTIIKRGRKLDKNDVIKLLKYCRMEARDLRNVFMFAIQRMNMAQHKLHALGKIIISNLGLNASLGKEYNRAVERLKRLKMDIETQYKRLDNEFKKSGFIPIAEIRREIRMAA